MRRMLACVVALHASTPWAAPAAGGRPNIVLVMADDVGYECVAADGGESYRTPHLDRLAGSGVRFDSCHVQPLCTPTRVQLMTGRHNVRNYVRFGVLPRTETTFAHLLKPVGYATAVCGKWQLGQEKDSPRHFGFDESLLWQHTRRPPRYANPGLERDGVERDFRGGAYGPELINEYALDFIGRHRAGPFLLYYPMILAHDPFQPTPDSPDWDPTATGERVNRDVRHFADMIAFMDRMIGRIDSRLGELGIRDDTLLLFLGDNGTNRTVTTRFRGGAYPGGKGTTTARGTHVPFIASWPAVMKQGRVNRDLISAADFLPTLCAVAGVPVPADTDGISFLPQLRGERGTPREWLYCWYSPRQKADLSVHEFAFDHGHKLYRDNRFFDLVADPFEQTPLAPSADANPAASALAKLRRVLDRFQEARPAELDREFERSLPQDPAPGKGRRGRTRARGLILP